MKTNEIKTQYAFYKYSSPGNLDIMLSMKGQFVCSDNKRIHTIQLEGFG